MCGDGSYFTLVLFSSFLEPTPAYHRIQVFQMVASVVFRMCAKISPLFKCDTDEQAYDSQ